MNTNPFAVDHNQIVEAVTIAHRSHNGVIAKMNFAQPQEAGGKISCTVSQDHERPNSPVRVLLRHSVLDPASKRLILVHLTPDVLDDVTDGREWVLRNLIDGMLDALWAAEQEIAGGEA